MVCKKGKGLDLGPYKHLLSRKLLKKRFHCLSELLLHQLSRSSNSSSSSPRITSTQNKKKKSHKQKDLTSKLALTDACNVLLKRGVGTVHDKKLQLNLSTKATLGTEESGLCGEVLNKSQCMDFFVQKTK